MVSESGVTRSIIDELLSSDIQGDQMELKVDLLEVSLMNFILRQSNEIKWEVKVLLLGVPLMNFILRIWSKVR